MYGEEEVRLIRVGEKVNIVVYLSSAEEKVT